MWIKIEPKELEIKTVQIRPKIQLRPLSKGRTPESLFVTGVLSDFKAFNPLVPMWSERQVYSMVNCPCYLPYTDTPFILLVSGLHFADLLSSNNSCNLSLSLFFYLLSVILVSTESRHTTYTFRKRFFIFFIF